MRYLIFDVTDTKGKSKKDSFHTNQLIFIEDSDFDLDNLLERLLKFEGKEYEVLDTKELVLTHYKVISRREYSEKLSKVQPLNKYMLYYVNQYGYRNKTGISVADFKTNDEDLYLEKLEEVTNTKFHIGLHVWNTENNLIEIFEKQTDHKGNSELRLMFTGNLYEYRSYNEECLREKSKQILREKRKKIIRNKENSK